MIKQNRALGFLFIFAFIIVGLILFRTGLIGGGSSDELVITSDGTDTEKRGSSAQEAMGDPVNATAKPVGASKDTSSDGSPDEQKSFAEVLKAMTSCLQATVTIPAAVPATAENFLALLQTAWGAPNLTDRWMNWHFHNREGVERRLRLEVTDSSNGAPGRELHYFAVDREGLPIPMALENVQTHNPSDEVIDGILKEGEVFFKEKSVGGNFPGGQLVEYIEKNGTLDSFEVHRADKTFHCPSLKTCLCK
jgi:hypothetical protein